MTAPSILRVLLLGIGGVAALAAVAVILLGPPPGAGASFADNFESGFLDPSRWSETGAGDVAARTTAIVADGGNGTPDHWLSLGAETIGTRDDTVKFVGVRSRQPVPVAERTEASVELDWNGQENGCYLSAGFYLCPTSTDANPEDEPDWLRVEYIGVPPGSNARAVVAIKTAGRVETLFSDGWPENRSGRPIGRQRLRILLEGGRVRLFENGNELTLSGQAAAVYPSAYVYLQVSSHSNYPLRTVRFDDVAVRPA